MVKDGQGGVPWRLHDKMSSSIVDTLVVWSLVCIFLKVWFGTAEHYFLRASYFDYPPPDQDYFCGLFACEEARAIVHPFVITLLLSETARLVVEKWREILSRACSLALWLLENIIIIPLTEYGGFVVEITAIVQRYSIWKHLCYVYRAARLIGTQPRAVPHKAWSAFGYSGAGLCTFVNVISATIRGDRGYRLRHLGPQWFLREVEAVAASL